MTDPDDRSGMVKRLRDNVWHVINEMLCNAQFRQGTVLRAKAAMEDVRQAAATIDSLIREREEAVKNERERCAKIAEAIDSGRGNEKLIAESIRSLPSTGERK
jgi:hypothetical protein